MDRSKSLWSSESKTQDSKTIQVPKLETKQHKILGELLWQKKGFTQYLYVMRGTVQSKKEAREQCPS